MAITMLILRRMTLYRRVQILFWKEYLESDIKIDIRDFTTENVTHIKYLSQYFIKSDLTDLHISKSYGESK